MKVGSTGPRGRIVIATAGVLVAGTAAVLLMSTSSDAEPQAPIKQLQCGDARIVSTHVSHDDTTRETRQPSELASIWQQATAANRRVALTSQKTTYSSSSRTDVTYLDGAGRIAAVLTYEHDSSLGWRLESIVECGG